MSTETSERVTLLLPSTLLQRLDRLAFNEHRSRSNAAALLLAEALAHRAGAVPAEARHTIHMESQHDCR